MLAACTAAVLISGCSQDGVGLARQACTHVARSITLYQEAEHATDPGRRAALAQAAYEQLRQALPLAADATSENGQWNPLMTTLAESSRVSEQYLITGLKAQCSFANSANPQLPPVPTTLPPAPGNNGSGSGTAGSGTGLGGSG
jgi:hypothetical protein